MTPEPVRTPDEAVTARPVEMAQQVPARNEEVAPGPEVTARAAGMPSPEGPPRPEVAPRSGAAMPAYDAVVLAGGRGRRLGGVDKALVQVGGRSLLAVVLQAVSGARQTICVGPARVTDRAVIWCREEPINGGPAAALAAALRAVSADLVVVAAVDLPFLDSLTVGSLVGAVGDADGAVAVDVSGSAQPLLAAYRRTAVCARVDGLPSVDGARMKDVIAGLRLTPVSVGRAAADCDTVTALAAARAALGG